MTYSLPQIDNRTILTPTSGYLKTGFTHTINLYHGCAFAGSLCGLFCYAQHNRWITKGRPWGLYGVKKSVLDPYKHGYDLIKTPHRGAARPLRVFMSSSTDPYPPQEQRLRLAQSLLQAMLERPPDVLVLQTHSTLIGRDLDLILALSKKCSV